MAVVVGRKRLLVTDRFERTVGVDGPIVDAVCQPVEVLPVRVAEAR